MTSSAQLALARAAYDPEAALAAIPEVDQEPVALEVVAGVPALERTREHGLTLAIEVDPPPPFKRWRYFLFYVLVKLAARAYPFKFEIYRTRQPWE